MMTYLRQLLAGRVRSGVLIYRIALADGGFRYAVTAAERTACERLHDIDPTITWSDDDVREAVEAEAARRADESVASVARMSADRYRVLTIAGGERPARDDERPALDRLWEQLPCVLWTEDQVREERDLDHARWRGIPMASPREECLGVADAPRPSWDDYFFGLAFLASRRSRDVHTKHGCVIVSRDNHVLATGYNSFPVGMDDASLPLDRPAKYDWMNHSEANALANMTVPPMLLRGLDARAYITGQPCNPCSRLLHQSGVRIWHIADRKGHTSPPPQDAANFERLARDGGVRVYRSGPDLRWLLDRGFVDELRSLGFLAVRKGDQREPVKKGDQREPVKKGDQREPVK